MRGRAGSIRLVLVATIVAVEALCALTAVAQDRREPPPEAVDFYASGQAHFSAGRYREAIADLERALVLDPGSPTLIYNLARVNELLGELDDSISYYNRYLQLLPEDQADERSRVEETVGRLEGARTQVDTEIPFEAGEGFGENLRQPSYQTENVADAAFWITAGGAAALIAAGVVVGILALQKESEAQELTLGMEIIDNDGTIRELNLNDRNDLANTADNLAIGADILLAAGLAASVAATLLYVLRTRTVEVFSRDSASIYFDTDGDRATVGARGQF